MSSAFQSGEAAASNGLSLYSKQAESQRSASTSALSMRRLISPSATAVSADGLSRSGKSAFSSRQALSYSASSSASSAMFCKNHAIASSAWTGTASSFIFLRSVDWPFTSRQSVRPA